MKIYRTEMQEMKYVSDTCCDKCGKSCMGSVGNFCGIKFTVSGGYDSTVFPDDETVRAYDICEACAHEWLKTFPTDYLLIGSDSNN